MTAPSFVRLTRAGILFAVIVALSWMLSARADVAGAAGQGSIDNVAVANGVSRVNLDYRGSTSAPADALGDRIEFRLVGAGAAHFVEGGTLMVKELGGEFCEALPTDVPFEDLERCFATASVVSTEEDFFSVRILNLDSPGGLALEYEAAFLEARAVIPGVDTVDSRRNQDGFAIQNIGSEPATVVVSFLTGAGERAKLTGAISPGSTWIGGDDGELPDMVATMSVGSDQPIAVLSYHTYQERDGRVRYAFQRGFPIDPFGKAGTYTLPYVAHNLEGAYNTRFYIVNTSLESACVRITYHFVAGAGSVGPEGRPSLRHTGLPAGGCSNGGLIVLPGREQFFSPPPYYGIALPEATRNTLMSVTVDGIGGSFAVAVRAYTSDGTVKEAAYEGFEVGRDTGSEIAVPIALKTSDGYYTHILFSNPNPDSVNVEIEYRGNTGVHTVNKTLAPLGVDNHSTYSDGTVPLGFVGAAVVRASGPIAVVVFRAKKVSPASEVDEDLYTALSGVPRELANTHAYFPIIARRLRAGGGYSGVNSWISVSAPGGGQATVTLTAVGSCGGPATVYTESKTFTGSMVFYQNAEADTGLGSPPPDCFYGAVSLLSDVPVVATASYISDLYIGDTEAVYNAVTFQDPPR